MDLRVTSGAPKEVMSLNTTKPTKNVQVGQFLKASKNLACGILNHFHTSTADFESKYCIQTLLANKKTGKQR